MKSCARDAAKMQQPLDSFQESGTFWVRSLDVLSRLADQVSSLICEECEKDFGVVLCEDDNEVLCPRCCGLLYPNTSRGKPHRMFATQRIRLLKATDKSGAIASKTIPLPETEITCDDWEDMGRDRSKAWAVEAPRKNAMGHTASRNRSTPKFRAGDVVLFSPHQCVPSNILAATGAQEGSMMWGHIMGSSVPRHGAFGHAVRETDGHEPVYRIRCQHWVGKSHSGMATIVKTWRETLSKRYFLERQKNRNLGKRPAPLAKERLLAWVNDKKILRAMNEKQAAGPECDGEALVREDYLPSVVVATESELRFPEEHQALLDARKMESAAIMLIVADNWLYFCRLSRAATTWHYFVDNHRRAERVESAVVLQRNFRMWRHQGTLAALRKEELDRMWNEDRTRILRFKPLTREEDRKNGYSIDGAHFFSTLNECNMYALFVEDVLHELSAKLSRNRSADLGAAWGRWWAVVHHKRHLERMPVSHLQPLHFAIAFGGGLGGSSATDRWHPAQGIALPQLPNMWSTRDGCGGRFIHNTLKYNSFRATMCGPTDDSNWIINSALLAGSYPHGKARRKGKQPSPKSAIGQLLLAGISVFVSLMETNEQASFEHTRGLEPLHAVVASEHKRMLTQLKNLVVKTKSSLFLASKEVKACPVYRPNDLRYRAAREELNRRLARQRMAFRAHRDAERTMRLFPETLTFRALPIPDGGVPKRESLNETLNTIENDLRLGHKLLLFSQLGHGRTSVVAACMLGRLYGCPLYEVEDRIQEYHDSRTSVRQSTRTFSAPQTMEQRQLIKEVIYELESIYAPTRVVQKMSDKVGIDHQSVVTFVHAKRRGLGLPEVLPKTEESTRAPRPKSGQKARIEASMPASHVESRTKAKHQIQSGTLPRLPCPISPTCRTLRPKSTIEEIERSGLIARALTIASGPL